MKKLFILLLVFYSLKAAAQDTIKNTGNADSVTSVRVPAMFPDGADAWRNFLNQHVHKDVAANHRAPQGNYIVTVSFLIDTTGEVTEVTILNDPGYGTAEDVKRAFKNCPDWIPGHH